MGFPRTQTHPAKVSFAGLVLANHVITATILLNGGSTSWAFFGICRYPIGRLGIVVTLLDPFLDQMTTDWIMPILRTCKTKGMATAAFDWPSLNVRHFDCIAAIGSRAPSHKTIAL